MYPREVGSPYNSSRDIMQQPVLEVSLKLTDGNEDPGKAGDWGVVWMWEAPCSEE